MAKNYLLIYSEQLANDTELLSQFIEIILETYFKTNGAVL